MIQSLTSAPLSFLLVIAVLLLVGRALLGGVAAAAALIGELLTALFAGLRALAVVGLLLVCLVLLFVASLGSSPQTVAVGSVLLGR